jgi:hypothetical protein
LILLMFFIRMMGPAQPAMSSAAASSRRSTPTHGAHRAGRRVVLGARTAAGG